MQTMYELADAGCEIVGMTNVHTHYRVIPGGVEYTTEHAVLFRIN